MFRARPLPPSTFAGVTGVPKVAKRPTTEPFSPILGARRKQDPNNGGTISKLEEKKEIAENHKDGTSQAKRPSTSSLPSVSTGGLLGLSFVGSSHHENENNPPTERTTDSEVDKSLPGMIVETTKPMTSSSSSSTAFVPCSTARAQKRAEFAARIARDNERREQDRAERLRKIAALKKELQKLLQKI